MNRTPSYQLPDAPPPPDEPPPPLKLDDELNEELLDEELYDELDELLDHEEEPEDAEGAAGRPSYQNERPHSQIRTRFCCSRARRFCISTPACRRR